MKSIPKYLILMLAGLSLSCAGEKEAAESSALFDLSEMEPITEVDERYQSINVEMCEVVGGEFWVPYSQIDTAKVQALGFAGLK